MYDPDKLYPASDAALRIIGSYFTMARWRSENRGPAFIKMGARVVYSGRDLNDWLQRQRVATADQPEAA